MRNVNKKDHLKLLHHLTLAVGVKLLVNKTSVSVVVAFLLLPVLGATRKGRMNGQ